MINERRAKEYCFEDISLIENYDKAIADTTQTWHCHHRWETDRNLTADELKFCNEYVGVPADRLIFLTESEHTRLHKLGNTYMRGKHLSEEAKQKLHEALSGEKNPWYGRHHSEESKQKMCEAKLGKHRSEDTKQKIREAHLGKPLSKEHKQKLSEAKRGENNPAYGKHWWNNGSVNKRSKECPGPEWTRGMLK